MSNDVFISAIRFQKNAKITNAAAVTHKQITTIQIPRMLLASVSSFLKSIPVWGWFDVGFTLMVLVGVCGESSKVSRYFAKFLVPNKALGFEMLVNWKSKSLKIWAERILIIGIAGEVVCLSFSLKDSAELSSETEKLRASNLELEKQIQPRRTTPQQQAAIINDLYRWRFVKDKCKIKVTIQKFDIEATIFAIQIGNLLANCGFSVEVNPNVNASDPLQFGTRFSAHDPVQFGAREVSQALKRLPINPFHEDITKNFEDGVLEIHVDSKPLQ
jgi:hypothetical protein